MFKVINAGNVEKHGIGLPKRHGGTHRSQSGEVAGPVVRGLEAPGAHPSGGAGAYERYATLGLFGHGGVVGVSNATGLREACIAVNRFLRTRFPDGPGRPSPCFSIPAWACTATSRTCPGTRIMHWLWGSTQEGGCGSKTTKGTPRPGWKTRRAAGSCEGRAVAGHARQARQLRCSPLPQGRTPRGQHVGSCCLCPTSLCSGDGAAPAGAERSGLPVACVKLIAGKREHFLGR